TKERDARAAAHVHAAPSCVLNKVADDVDLVASTLELHGAVPVGRKTIERNRDSVHAHSVDTNGAAAGSIAALAERAAKDGDVVDAGQLQTVGNPGWAHAGVVDRQTAQHDEPRRVGIADVIAIVDVDAVACGVANVEILDDEIPRPHEVKPVAASLD